MDWTAALPEMGRQLLGSRGQASSRTITPPNWSARGTEGAVVQIAFAFLAIGYILGHLSYDKQRCRYKMMGEARFFLFVGHMIFCFWSGLDSQYIYFDYLAWNLCMAVVNLVQLIIVLSHDETVKLDDHLTLLWDKKFGPEHFNLEKIDFYHLVQERAQLETVITPNKYLGEQDVPHRLSILIEGHMTITKSDDWGRRDVTLAVFQEENPDDSDMIVGEVQEMEFIDSFEWLASGLDQNHSQVTIKGSAKATVDENNEQTVQGQSVVIYWHYDVLKEIFKEHSRLRACMMAMVGKDVAEKLLLICGHSMVKLDTYSDLIRKKDKFWQCWREAGLKTGERLEKQLEAQEQDLEGMSNKQRHPSYDIEEVVARLRIANARMLALQPSPLENLQPTAGVSSNIEHGAKLLNFFRRVVPDLPQSDLHELIKWGKWREYRKQFTVFLRKGEKPYYLGVVLDGQLDVLDEELSTCALTFKHSIKEFELVGSEEFGNKKRTRSPVTVRIASHGAVLFVWDVKDLQRLMVADPRVKSVMSTLLRGDITLKMRDSQSVTNRVCGSIDAMRRDGDNRGCVGGS
jgi:hypothetical protein